MFDYDHLTPSVAWRMPSELDCVLYWHQSADPSWPIRVEYWEPLTNHSRVSALQPMRGELRKLSHPIRGRLLTVWQSADSMPAAQGTAIFLSPHSRQQQRRVTVILCTALYCNMMHLHTSQYTMHPPVWYFWMYMHIYYWIESILFRRSISILQIPSLQIQNATSSTIPLLLTQQSLSEGLCTRMYNVQHS